MPLYRFTIKTGDGHNAYLADHVYELSEEYARALNEERAGRCVPWTGAPVASGSDVSSDVPVPPEPKTHMEGGKGEGAPPTLKGAAWRVRGESRGRIASGS